MFLSHRPFSVGGFAMAAAMVRGRFDRAIGIFVARSVGIRLRTSVGCAWRIDVLARTIVMVPMRPHRSGYSINQEDQDR